MKYKKKPVEIEAIQWKGEENIKRIKTWLGDNLISEERDGIGVMGHWIKTLEGDMMISYGDYIIKGIKGEFYSCKPDIFEQSYESNEKYYIIIWNKDWADEFNTFGFDIITEELYKNLIKLFNTNDDVLYDNLEEILSGDYCFGTNEDQYFDILDIIDIFKDSVELTYDEYKVFDKIFNNYYSLNGILISEGQSFIYNVLEKLEENNIKL